MVAKMFEEIGCHQEEKAKLMFTIKELQDEISRINTERKLEKKAKKAEAEKTGKKKKTKKKKKPE